MALTFPTYLPPTRSGRTFFLALCLLGIGALTQLAVMGGYLLHGGIASRRAASSLAGASPALHFAETVQPESSAFETSTVLPTLVPTPAPAWPPNVPDAGQGGTAGQTLARPTPARSAVYPAPSGDLLEQARQLRVRGDTRSALARLREAQVAEPDNPQIIAELALTYEAVQLPDRAFEQWQRLYAMGESIGALYYLADGKLHSAPLAQAAPGRPALSPGDTAGVNPGGATVAAGAVLKLADIHREDYEDPTAAQKFALKIVVKGRPGTVVDPVKVRILTYFYDLVDGKDIVLTDAQTGFAWLTPPPVNWANDKSEVLETTYLRLKGGTAPLAPETSAPDPAADAARNNVKGKPRRGGKAVAEATPAPTPTPSATPAPVRTYLGYTVRLYYDHQLQDVQADPVRLMEKFPPPLTLTDD